jgi:hypothetical protein
MRHETELDADDLEKLSQLRQRFCSIDADQVAIGSRLAELVVLTESEDLAMLRSLYAKHVMGVDISGSDQQYRMAVVKMIFNPRKNDGLGLWNELFAAQPEMFTDGQQTWLRERDPNATTVFEILRGSSWFYQDRSAGFQHLNGIFNPDDTGHIEFLRKLMSPQ